MDRVDRDVSDAEVFVEVPVRGNVAAAVLDLHFDLQRSAGAHGGDVEFLVEDLDVGVVFDVGGSVQTIWVRLARIIRTLQSRRKDGGA
jgi:hypothetical protein